MIKSSETRDNGSCERKSLATWHWSNVAYFGITPKMLSRDFSASLQWQVAMDFLS